MVCRDDINPSIACCLEGSCRKQHIEHFSQYRAYCASVCPPQPVWQQQGNLLQLITAGDIFVLTAVS